MSLILRKECQEHLNNVGLNNLHVEVRDTTLIVVNECGKRITTVNGIQFNNKRVTKAEIEYATELFEVWCIKHASLISEYLNKLRNVPKVDTPDNLVKEHYSHYYIYTHKEGVVVRVDLSDDTFSIDGFMNKEFINSVVDIINEAKDIVYNYHKESLKVIEYHKELEELNSKLNSCSI